MPTSSEYNVNIIISTQKKGTGAKQATGALDQLKKKALQLAATYISIKGVKMAAEFVKQGAAVQRAARALDNLAKEARTSGDEIIDAIQEASNFTIDRMSAMEAANKALLLGVADSPEEFAELAEQAVLLGRAMGQDAAKSIDDFVVAAGRQSKQIADNLGLMVSAEDANLKYAKSHGILVSEMTDLNRKEAFRDEMLAQAAEKTKALTGNSLGLAEAFGQVSSFATDVKDDLADIAATYADVSIKQATFILEGTLGVSDLRTTWGGFVDWWQMAIVAGAGTAGTALRSILPSWDELASRSDAERERWGRYGQAVAGVTTKTVEVKDATEEMVKGMSGIEAQSPNTLEALDKQAEAMATLAEKTVGLQTALKDAAQAQIAQAAIGELSNLLAEGKITSEDYKTAVTETQLAFGLADEASVLLTEKILDLTTRFGEGEIKAEDFDEELLNVSSDAYIAGLQADYLGQMINAIPTHKTVTIDVLYTGGTVPTAAGLGVQMDLGVPAGGGANLGRVTNNTTTNNNNVTINTQATTSTVTQDLETALGMVQ